MHEIAEYPDGLNSLVGMSNFVKNGARTQPHTNWSVTALFCRAAAVNLVRPGQRPPDSSKTTMGSSHVYERRPYVARWVID
jgi:hypothetical protein